MSWRNVSKSTDNRVDKIANLFKKTDRKSKMILTSQRNGTGWVKVLFKMILEWQFIEH